MSASYDPTHITKLSELYSFLTGIWTKCKNMFAAKSDLSTVATSGSYNDLSDKPPIPAAQVQSDWSQSDSTQVDFIKNKPSIPAAQVQSDWNQSDNTQVDFIKNKPSIPAAQVQSDWNQSDNTQVDFIKNKPSIPAAQVQSDWNQSDNTQVDYIKNKPTIPTVPTTDQTYNASSTNPQSGTALAGAIGGVRQVPASSSADSGKILTVNSSGSPEWQTAGGTVDQTYDPVSANAQSGTAVAGALATVKQVPASVAADEGKVLTVDSSGNAVWDDLATVAQIQAIVI